jgi:hypothetical protein
MDRAATHKAGKAGADLPLLPVNFVAEEGADRAELGLMPSLYSAGSSPATNVAEQS